MAHQLREGEGVQLVVLRESHGAPIWRESVCPEMHQCAVVKTMRMCSVPTLDLIGCPLQCRVHRAGYFVRFREPQVSLHGRSGNAGGRQIGCPRCSAPSGGALDCGRRDAREDAGTGAHPACARATGPAGAVAALRSATDGAITREVRGGHPPVGAQPRHEAQELLGRGLLTMWRSQCSARRPGISSPPTRATA